MPDEITVLSESTEFVDFKIIDGIFDNLEDRKRLSPSAAIGARNIIRIWRVPPASAATLIGVSLGTWYRIRRNHWSGSFTQDQMTRISLLISIYRGLQVRLGEDLGNRWVTLANNGPLFRGRTPCEFMVAQGILGMWQVRRYVDAIG
ncbi:MAG: DUF2384 domain-containing protein [Burkholderiales bacterium]|nr:DUF2384 domain-containing protein [Burkholderiales bacterium]